MASLSTTSELFPTSCIPYSAFADVSDPRWIVEALHSINSEEIIDTRQIAMIRILVERLAIHTWQEEVNDPEQYRVLFAPRILTFVQSEIAKFQWELHRDVRDWDFESMYRLIEEADWYPQNRKECESVRQNLQVSEKQYQSCLARIMRWVRNIVEIVVLAPRALCLTLAWWHTNRA